MAAQKVALVTGASSGVGKATAIALAKAGFLVFPAARRVEEMRDLENYGCRPVHLDLRDGATLVKAVELASAVHGAVDVLVNNAADGSLGPLETTDIDGMRRQFETNIFGATHLIQLVLDGMRNQKSGRIINVSSMGGEHTTPCSGSYHATKYATEALSDSWRYELAPFGIQVAVVQPAVIDTPMARTSADNFKAMLSVRYYGKLLHKMGEMAEKSVASGTGVISADDVAKAIVHAATANRAKTRYKVGIAAHILPAMRRWLPDRAYDAVWRRAFNTPIETN